MISTLLASALGIIGTLTGVIVTQRQASRRDVIAWQRERVRELERWGREDVARTFEHRRTAYVEFYESLRDMTFLIYNHGMGLGEEPETPDDSENDEFGTMPTDFQLPTFRKLQHLRIYATSAVAEAATDAYNAAWRWGSHTAFGEDDGDFYDRMETYDATENNLLASIRFDLKIPEPSTELAES